MKISLKPLVLSFAVFGLALSASAQGAVPTSPGVTPATGSAYGLLGEKYMGATFGYTTIDDGPPDSAHTYGFIASSPTEMANVDASFKYNYTSASAFGVDGHGHEFAIGATGYVRLSGMKPFAEANVGWGFAKVAGFTEDSFGFLLGVGVEFQLAPRVALTPYVNYQEYTRIGTGRWTYGVKSTFRMVQQFSASIGVELDDYESVSYKLAINRHF